MIGRPDKLEVLVELDRMKAAQLTVSEYPRGDTGAAVIVVSGREMAVAGSDGFDEFPNAVTPFCLSLCKIDGARRGRLERVRNTVELSKHEIRAVAEGTKHA